MRLLNKKGLTIAEAVIAMVLLAVVTMGIYGVILASVRTGKKPDMREDMAYAIESVSASLKALVQGGPLCVQWNATNDTCDFWDSCLQPNIDGTCPGARATCSQDTDSGVYGCADANGLGRQIILQQRKGYPNPTFDLCGRPLPNEFVRDAGDNIASVNTPLEPGYNYYIDFQNADRTQLCRLPSSCNFDESSFYYTIVNLNAANAALPPLYQVQFHIVCNGQIL